MGAALAVQSSFTATARSQPYSQPSCPSPPRHPRGLTPEAPQPCRRTGHAAPRPSVAVEAVRQWDTGCRLAGSGSSAPASVLTNTDLEQLVETNDDWIATRTGIRERRVLAEGETLSQHAVASSQQALDMAGLDAQQLDLILLATSSPDDIFGSACEVQKALGAKHAMAFDITAACSGFVVALVTAAQFIRTGQYSNVLVIGGDALSRFVDWRDRSTCILFGDGCGAVVLTAQQGQCGLLGSSMHSDGGGQKHLNAAFHSSANKALSNGHASSLGEYSNIHMNGSEVFKFAVRAVPAVVDRALQNAELSVDQIDWLVLHQANQRILDSAAERLGVAKSRVVSNLARYGNTSAGSIPLALDEAVRGGQIQPGSTVAFAGFGAGLTWASAIVRWQ